MDFGQALNELKAGKSVSREGWNGKEMHIYLEDGYEMAKGHGTHRVYEPVVVLFNAQKKHQPGWLPSQADLLADDWGIVQTRG